MDDIAFIHQMDARSVGVVWFQILATVIPLCHEVRALLQSGHISAVKKFFQKNSDLKKVFPYQCFSLSSFSNRCPISIHFH